MSLTFSITGQCLGLDTPCQRRNLCWLLRFQIHKISLRPAAGRGDKGRHLQTVSAGYLGSKRTILTRVRRVLSSASAQTSAEGRTAWNYCSSGNCFLPFYCLHTHTSSPLSQGAAHSLRPPSPFHRSIPSCWAQSSAGRQKAPLPALGKNHPCQPRGNHSELRLLSLGGKSTRSNFPRGKREPGKGGGCSRG